jgi:hypothetical protein
MAGPHLSVVGIKEKGERGCWAGRSVRGPRERALGRRRAGEGR